MKRSRLLSAIALLVSMSFCVAPVRSAGSRFPPRDDEGIRKVVADFSAAVNKHDARAFSMVFHEDADFTNIWGMRATGRKAIEDFHRPLFEGDGVRAPSFKSAVFKVLDTK